MAFRITPSRLAGGPAKMAATNKCLAQSNKSRTGGKATKNHGRAAPSGCDPPHQPKAGSSSGDGHAIGSHLRHVIAALAPKPSLPGRFFRRMHGNPE